MGMRLRPLMTLFLVLGLVGVVSISTLFASGQLPGVGGFDAAQHQYDKKDKKDKKNKKNKKDKKNKKNKKDEAAPPPGGAVLGARSCARRPFRTERGFAACNGAAALVASGTLTPAQACGGFPVTLGRRAACVAAAGPPPPGAPGTRP